MLLLSFCCCVVVRVNVRVMNVWWWRRGFVNRERVRFLLGERGSGLEKRNDKMYYDGVKMW